MTPKQSAASYLKGQLRPLEAAVQILAGYGSLPDQPIWQTTGGANGPLSGLYVAADEVDRIGYIGSDPDWWHAEVKASKQADLAETQRRMQPVVKAACVAIIEHSRGRRNGR